MPAYGENETAGGAPVRILFPRGQSALCRNVPNREVKKYPELKSKRPLYGSVTFDANYYFMSGETGTPAARAYDFVLDESGEAEAAEAAKNQKKDGDAEEPSLLQTLTEALKGPAPPSDRFRSTRYTYDRLYFDLDGDRDLTNDGVIQVTKEPIFAALSRMRQSPSICWFNELVVSFDFGAPLGKRPFPLVPLVQIYGQDFGRVQFIPKMARTGKIRLAGEEYVVSLTQASTVSGRYDRPFVQLDVSPADSSSKAEPLLKSGLLGRMQVVDGQFLTLSASPLGDKLTIAPYRGDFGTFDLGTGGRTITERGVAGQLYGRSTMVLLGESSSAAPETLLPHHKVPVGDYRLPSLIARYGRIRFSARMIANADASSGPGFAVEIRKDKPYVLELSGKPEAKFVSPKEGQEFKPGDRVHIAAMLTEPWQGMQITGLWDATKKEKSLSYVVDGGRVVTVPRYAQLDPTIVIRNSAGEEVASGKMPFG